jgi:hypothetical protein
VFACGCLCVDLVAIWALFGGFLQFLSSMNKFPRIQPRGPWSLLLLLLLLLMSMVCCVVPFDDNSNLAFSTRSGRLFVILMMMLLLLLVTFFFCFSTLKFQKNRNNHTISLCLLISRLVRFILGVWLVI